MLSLRTPSFIGVPQGYISGDPLRNTTSWINATYASLGMTPGVYTWSWGSGADATPSLLTSWRRIFAPDGTPLADNSILSTLPLPTSETLTLFSRGAGTIDLGDDAPRLRRPRRCCRPPRTRRASGFPHKRPYRGRRRRLLICVGKRGPQCQRSWRIVSRANGIEPRQSECAIPGTYVWRWGMGEHADTLTLQIGPSVSTPAAPELATWAMILVGFAGLGYAAVRRKSAVSA